MPSHAMPCSSLDVVAWASVELGTEANVVKTQVY